MTGKITKRDVLAAFTGAFIAAAISHASLFARGQTVSMLGFNIGVQNNLYMAIGSVVLAVVFAAWALKSK